MGKTMDILRRKIYESFVFNFIVNLVEMAKHSHIMKPNSKTHNRTHSEKFMDFFLIRFLLFVDEIFEKAFKPFRKLWDQSWLVVFFREVYKNITTNSFVGAIIKEANFIYVIALYVYVDKVIRIFAGPLSGIWDELFFLVIVAFFIYSRIIWNKRYVYSAMDLPIAFFALIFMLLVFINSPDFAVAIEGFRVVVQHVLWYYLALQLLRDRITIHRTLWTFIVGVGLLGFHGIYQYLTKAPMLGNWVDSGETITTRAYSIIDSPNAFASLLVLFIPIGFAMFIAHKDILLKIIALIFTLAMGVSLLVTFSRGAWIAAFLSVIVFFVFMARRMILFIFAVVLASLFNIGAIYNRFSYMFTQEYRMKSANGGRIYRYNYGLDKVTNDKAIGLGLGRFGGAVATNHNLAPFYMDNYYLKTFIETGYVGITTFALLILTLLFNSVKYILGIRDKEDRILAYGIFSGMIGVLIHNFVENIFELPFMVIYFWVCAAMIVAMYKCGHRKGVD
ncbi:MAG: polymerase [Firmicutes bacterium HGW-Firmicutes-3]|jgi:hypothetical protein|nr:MAG: polymerase [Firmicutes bacterium HGW-Firmicutes-3]